MANRNILTETEEEYAHALGQFRLQLNGVFSPFMEYGHQDFVPEAKLAVEILALRLHKRLNGKDIPIVKEPE